jgi:hypothetical protein
VAFGFKGIYSFMDTSRQKVANKITSISIEKGVVSKICAR